MKKTANIAANEMIDQLRTHIRNSSTKGKLERYVKDVITGRLVAFREENNLPQAVFGDVAHLYEPDASASELFKAVLPLALVQSGRYDKVAEAIDQAVETIQKTELEKKETSGADDALVPFAVEVRHVFDTAKRVIGFEIEQKYGRAA